jgi:hypothetical protein
VTMRRTMRSNDDTEEENFLISNHYLALINYSHPCGMKCAEREMKDATMLKTLVICHFFCVLKINHRPMKVPMISQTP